MITFEPPMVDGPTPDPESNPAITTVLNTNIKALTAAKNTVGIIPAKATFESTIAILTIVRVRVPRSAPFFTLTHW